MAEQKLLTLDESAQVFRLASAETFARFARRNSIPLIKMGGRVVRVRASDLECAIKRSVIPRDLDDEPS